MISLEEVLDTTYNTLTYILISIHSNMIDWIMIKCLLDVDLYIDSTLTCVDDTLSTDDHILIKW